MPGKDEDRVQVGVVEQFGRRFGKRETESGAGRSGGRARAGGNGLQLQPGRGAQMGKDDPARKSSRADAPNTQFVLSIVVAGHAPAKTA